MIGEAFLQSRGAGLVKANVQNELFLRHAFSIPDGFDPPGSEIKIY